VAEYHRNYYQKNKASFQAKSKEYSKIHSNDVKARCKKWYRDNKDRHRTYSEQYKKDNTDRVKEWSRLSSERQRKKHPDNQKRSYKKWYLKVRNTQSFKAKRGAIFMKYRALKKGASVNLKSIKSFMVRVKRNPTFVCYHCQHTFPISALHFDHIIPLSRGGSHSIGNLCTSCRPCNCSKNNTLLSEWSRLGQQLLPI
jgi:5-methylcytosine-specific restriction endonuclease McrA